MTGDTVSLPCGKNQAQDLVSVSWKPVLCETSNTLDRTTEKSGCTARISFTLGKCTAEIRLKDHLSQEKTMAVF